MKKILIISAAVLAVFIAGEFIYSRYTDLPEAPTQSSQPPQPASQLTSEKQGIEVTVESVERSAGQTIVRLAMNNHAYDLNEFGIKGLSSLNGVPVSDYKVLGDQVGGPASSAGGHHLEVDLIFPGELSGKLIVGMKEGLSFEFDL